MSAKSSPRVPESHVVTPPRRRNSLTPPAPGEAASSGGPAEDEHVTWAFRASQVAATPQPPLQQQPPAPAVLAAPLPRPVTTSLLPNYKILLIGDAAVGKSNLLTRFANNSFDIATRSTIGVEFVSRELELPTDRDGSNEKVNVQLWDTAGQERCGAISAAFFRGAKGVAVVYDCTRYPTLKNVPGWVAHAKQYADENCSFVVIGNKMDLRNLKAVSEEEAECVAHSLGLRHFYASALTGEGVPAAFLHLILSVNAMMRSQQIASPRLSSAAGGGRRTSVRSGGGGTGGQRVPVDVSGFGNTGQSSSGKSQGRCCR